MPREGLVELILGLDAKGALREGEDDHRILLDVALELRTLAPLGFGLLMADMTVGTTIGGQGSCGCSPPGTNGNNDQGS